MKGTHALGLGILAGAAAGIAIGRRISQPPQIPGLAILQRALAEERGEREAAALVDRMQARYRTLYAGRPQLESRALRFHLEKLILPGLALYQVLGEVDGDDEAALLETERLFMAYFGRTRKVMPLIGHLPAPFKQLRRGAKGIVNIGFPPQGWELEWVEDGDQAIAYNVHRCFYLDTLTAYGAPELTPLYCQMDDLLFEALPPEIRWERTKTLGRGDEICDFRWTRQEVKQQPGLSWRVIRLMNRCLAGTVKPWQRRGDLIMVLTTTGRFTGRPHVTPLQYERVNDLIYVGAARGQQADWFRNIVANPEVEVEMGGGRFVAQAEPITDPSRIADYLELRLRRHPRMIRAMLLLHGLPPRADRAQLEQLSEKLALVALPNHTPLENRILLMD